MNLLDYATSDFRDAAATVSVRLLQQHRLSSDSVDLATIDVSLCLPAPGDPVAKRKHLSILFLVSLAIPFALLCVGALFLYLGSNPPANLPVDHNVLSTIGFVIGGLGFAGILSALSIQGAIVRKKLREANNLDVSFDPTDILRNIGIENPATRTTIKLVIEDRANLFCDSSRKLIVIEGIFYRYVIHAQDVINCAVERTRAYPFLILEYFVADTETTLALAISYVTVPVEFKRKATFSLTKHPLVAVVERTFGFTLPYRRTDPGEVSASQ
jgi:hypothetical protein